MICPFCHDSDTKVVDSRLTKQGSTVRRRRMCPKCKKRFTTYESVEITLPMVCKNDGRREAYNREKILGGIAKSCQKRPISTFQINTIVDEIERQLQELNVSEIQTQEIGSLVMKFLKNLDPVAFVRFASVYQEFENIDEFMRGLGPLEHEAH